MKRLIAFLLVVLPGLDWASGMSLNPAVTPDTIGQTICVAGYTATIRPSAAYTNYFKAKIMKAKGLRGNPTDYELDHIVPLELGGHPWDEANFQVQPWTGPNGARAKDKIETYLHRMVCAGKLPLRSAQQCIFNNWQQCRSLIIKGAL